MLIKHEKYKQFLAGDFIEKIEREQFENLLKEVQHKNLNQARTLAIILWATGARPNELLRITGKDLTKNQSYLKIRIKGSKGGYAREIMLPIKDKLIKEVWDYGSKIFPDQFLFYSFRSNNKRSSIKKTYYKKVEGVRVKVEKTYNREYVTVSNNLHYHINKWFKIPPYYLRHNRLSIAAAKASMPQLMFLKGARSMESVRPYLHQSEAEAKKISRELIK